MATSDSPKSIAASKTLQVAAPGSSAPLVRFDFASGDTLSNPSINNIGFTWIGARTIAASPSGNLGMRFRFGPDGLTEDSSAEQNYELNGDYFELYERFTLEVPANFRTRIITAITMVDIAQTAGWEVGDHLTYGINPYGGQSSAVFAGTSGNKIYLQNADVAGYSVPWMGQTITNTSKSTTANSATEANQESGSGKYLSNNKFSALWTGTYGGSNGLCVFEYWPQYSDYTNIDGNRAQNMFGSTDTHGTQSNVASDGPDVQFLKAGETHEYTIHRRKSSAEGVSDAVAELWEDGVLIYYDRNGLNFHSVNNYFSKGYLLGYANSGFEEQTDFYITKYEFFGTNRPDGLE